MHMLFFQNYADIIEISKTKNHSTFKEFNKIVQDSETDLNPSAPKEWLYLCLFTKSVSGLIFRTKWGTNRIWMNERKEGREGTREGMTKGGRKIWTGQDQIRHKEHDLIGKKIPKKSKEIEREALFAIELSCIKWWFLIFPWQIKP